MQLVFNFVHYLEGQERVRQTEASQREREREAHQYMLMQMREERLREAEETQREADRESMMKTVVAGVVAGIEAQSQRNTTASRSAAAQVQTRLTGSITTLLGDIPIKGEGIDTDSMEWEIYLNAWVMAAGQLGGLSDDPHGGPRLQEVLSLILKHPAKALEEIADAEELISEGSTGVDQVLFTGAYPSLRKPAVWSKIPKPMQEARSAIQIFAYLVKLAPKNPAVEEEGVRTALYGAGKKPVQSLQTLADPSPNLAQSLRQVRRVTRCRRR